MPGERRPAADLSVRGDAVHDGVLSRLRQQRADVQQRVRDARGGVQGPPRPASPLRQRVHRRYVCIVGFTLMRNVQII